MNASTLIGENSISQYSQELEDIKSTIQDFATSIAAWNNPPDNSPASLKGYHFNPIIVKKGDDPWKSQLLSVLNNYRDAIENNTAVSCCTFWLRCSDCFHIK
jgi:septal ring factor EnvC (AmiA/AmiB activator)